MPFDCSSSCSLLFYSFFKCPSLHWFTHWVNPGWVISLILEKSGEYWVINYFKCSDVQNYANLWIFGPARLLDYKEHITYGKMYIKFIHKDWHNIYCLYRL